MNYDEVFLHEISRKVYNDCTITLDGILFEVPSTLKGERIRLQALGIAETRPPIPPKGEEVTV